MLQAIDDNSIDHALRLLSRGFPERTETFWRRGLDRARKHASPNAGWPLGYLLLHGDRPAGVMLTLASRRRDTRAESRTVVNLSSWYVEPELRGRAPLMLMNVVASRDDLFTDLTPTPAVLQMIDRLNFTAWNEGLVLSSWPQALAVKRRRSSVVPLSDVPGDAFDDATRALLDDHDRLGCLAAAIHDDRGWHPLIFLRRRIKGVPCGYVIYAPSRRAVLSSLRAVTAFLLRHGMPLFCIDGDRGERPPGAIFVPRYRKAFRGTMCRDRIDYAYSELVYFRLH